MGRRGETEDSAFTLRTGGGSGRAVAREAKGCLKQNCANGCKPRIQQSQFKFSINNQPVAVVLVNKEISHGRVFYTVGHNMLELACGHSKGL